MEIAPMTKRDKILLYVVLMLAFVVLFVRFLLIPGIENHQQADADLREAQDAQTSMQDTIMKGDRVLGNRLAYIKDDPERYDIVIFKYPDDPSKISIKRVIGLPGETVSVKEVKRYVDGTEQTQAVSFCPEEMAGSFGPYEVPEDSYFVMGDNRNNSLDSRYWDNTYVKKEAILAKAGFRYWPLNKVGFVNKSAEK